MDYKEVITKFNVSKDKESFAKKHIKRIYVPYTEKLSEAKKIAELSTHVIINGKTVYKKDTPIQYFLKIVRLLALYTDIDINENINVAYDALAEKGLIDILLSQIPESELTQFTTMVEMCVSDIYENERDLPSFIETKIEAFSLANGQLMESIKETINNSNIDQIVKNEVSKVNIDNQVTENDNAN